MYNDKLVYIYKAVIWVFFTVILWKEKEVLMLVSLLLFV